MYCSTMCQSQSLTAEALTGSFAELVDCYLLLGAWRIKYWQSALLVGETSGFKPLRVVLGHAVGRDIIIHSCFLLDWLTGFERSDRTF